MTRKFKGAVKKVEVKKLENATPNLPAGTFFIKVAWLCSHEELYDSWQEIPEGTSVWQDKVYWCSPNVKAGSEKSSLEITKEQLKDNFNFEGSTTDINSIEGYVNELVVEKNGAGYDQVKFVNNPNRKRSVIPKEDVDNFASIFDSKE